MLPLGLGHTGKFLLEFRNHKYEVTNGMTNGFDLNLDGLRNLAYFFLFFNSLFATSAIQFYSYFFFLKKNRLIEKMCLYQHFPKTQKKKYQYIQITAVSI